MTLRRRRDIWDVVVVGGGVAGLTATWQASRRGLATALFEAMPACGGQVATVESLDDWPASGPVSGIDLATGLLGSFPEEAVEVFYETVDAVRTEAGLLRVVAGSHGVRARRVIAAAGARLRVLGVPGEETLRGKGVSQCAHCDGGFFKGQDVVVIGGGDAALQEALVLSAICRQVTIVARSGLKARRAYVERAAGRTNVRFVWDHDVDAVLGEGGVSAVRLRSRVDGSRVELSCSGVFPFVGVEPNTAFLPDDLARDASGCIVTDAALRSSEPSIYAIGALRSGYEGDLVAAAGEAAAAAKACATELKF